LAIATSSLADLRALQADDWIYLVVLCASAGIIGHTLMSWLQKFIAASLSSLYLLSMNVVSMLLAWPVHHEPVTLVQAFGGVVVLGAVAAVLRRSASVPVVRVVPPPTMTS
jgi:drug/metabolite transporter (DMT)-like permease